LKQVVLCALEICYPRAEGQYVLDQWPLNKTSRIEMLKGWRAPMGGSAVTKMLAKTSKAAGTTAAIQSPAQDKERQKREKAIVVAAKSIVKRKNAEFNKALKLKNGKKQGRRCRRHSRG
jgi:hypothetical protein